MNEQSIQPYRPAADLLATISVEKVAATAGALIRYGLGGKPLNQTQAGQLALYALMTDLNPFNQEVYFGDVGPMVGVAGYRRKAKEYNRLHGRGEYHLEYRVAQPHEAEFDPENDDVAWVCDLTDDAKMEAWEKTLSKWLKTLIDADMDSEQAWERANFIAGKKPKWSAVGVVKGSEHFSKKVWEDNKPKLDEDGKPIYKAEMWDRNERAKKRAEKGALRKAYPDVLNVPEYGDLDSQGVDISVIVRDVVTELGKDRVVDEGETLKQLGFEATEEPGGSISDSQVEDAGQPAPDIVDGVLQNVKSKDTVLVDGPRCKVVVKGGKGTDDPVWDPAAHMSLDFALSEKASDGREYGDIPNDQLSARFNQMQGLIKKGADQEKRDEYKRKCAAIQVIFKHREEEGDD